MNALIKIIIADIGKLAGNPEALSVNVTELAATVAMANPVAAVGFAAVAASLGLITLYVQKLEKYNSTMREIDARLKRDEAACRRRVAEADQRAQDREGVARTSATQSEAPSKLREEETLAEAKKDPLKGIRPVVTPTREQFTAAKQRVQYDPTKFHFAVCGTAGSGKSSLINAFRGLNPIDEAAAQVGVTECTSIVTRYLDPREEFPYSLFVWYDIPGAGTINVPEWQYFNEQGIFVFDFIVIVYDGRFTEIDVGIIKNCLLFEIPFFVVRSKADQHIQNMMDDMGECERQKAVDKYVEVTRADFKRNLKKMTEAPELDARAQRLLLNQRVYIVSRPTLLHRLQTSKGTRQTPSQSKIDEDLLIEDMLKQAARRRCPDPDQAGTSALTLYRPQWRAFS